MCSLTLLNKNRDVMCKRFYIIYILLFIIIIMPEDRLCTTIYHYKIKKIQKAPNQKYSPWNGWFFGVGGGNTSVIIFFSIM